MEGNLWQSIPGFPTIADVKAANISVSVCFNFFFSFMSSWYKREEGTSNEKMPSLDWSVCKLVVHVLEQ